jgi:tRNA dimethylallyltransferase
VDYCPRTTSWESRYDTLCLWLYAEPTAHRHRLDARVDEMLQVSTHSHRVHYGLQTHWQNGLLDEVREMTRLLGTPNEASTVSNAPRPMDFTHGVLQSIGKFERIIEDDFFVLTRDRRPRVSSISH